jgi:3',5'-cyclic AMP phosphodiesterase CpdA
VSILLVQLGDIHIAGSSDAILNSATKIASAAAAEADSSVDVCCLLITGDVVQAGKMEEFDLALGFLTAIKTELDTQLQCCTNIICIPGKAS